MPAGSRNARPRAGRKLKPVGAAGTGVRYRLRIDRRATQEANSRQNHCGYPPPLNQAALVGSQKISSGPNALISLGLWEH